MKKYIVEIPVSANVKFYYLNGNSDYYYSTKDRSKAYRFKDYEDAKLAAKMTGGYVVEVTNE